jgi:hypothetical protein
VVGQTVEMVEQVQRRQDIAGGPVGRPVGEIEPVGEGREPVASDLAAGDEGPGTVGGAEMRRRAERHRAGPGALGGQEGEVEGDVVPDDRVTVEEVAERDKDVGGRRCGGQVIVPEPGELRDDLRQGLSGVDAGVEGVDDTAVPYGDGGDLDDAVVSQSMTTQSATASCSAAGRSSGELWSTAPDSSGATGQDGPAGQTGPVVWTGGTVRRRAGAAVLRS